MVIEVFLVDTNPTHISVLDINPFPLIAVTNLLAVP